MSNKYMIAESWDKVKQVFELKEVKEYYIIMDKLGITLEDYIKKFGNDLTVETVLNFAS